MFPTRYRSTSHGISAACGKIGSIIGQGAIATLRTRGHTADNAAPWMDHVLEIYALFMLLGCFTTYFIPETARKTLEELSGEDDYAVTYQESNGPGVDSEVITKISADDEGRKSPA